MSIKKTIYFLGLFLAVTLSQAQTATNCDALFQIATTITPSTCAGNGVVTISLTGDQSNIETSTITYQISGTTRNGTNFVQQATANSTLENIPPGTYTLTIQAQCKNNPSTLISKTKEITVTGPYYIPAINQNLELSRASFKEVPTGKIVLNVTGTSDNLSFFITKGPGITTRTPYTATKVKEGVYRIDDDTFPAGEYTIEAEHNTCKDIASTIAIVKETSFRNIYPSTEPLTPSLNSEYSPHIVFPYSTTSKPNITNIIDTENYKHVEDKLFEFSYSFNNEEPQHWYPFTPYVNKYEYTKVDLGTYTIEDMFLGLREPNTSHKNPKYSIRLKNSKGQTHTYYQETSPYNLRNYYLFSNFDYTTSFPQENLKNNQYKLTLKHLVNRFASNIYTSFPIKVEIVEKETQQSVFSEENYYVADSVQNIEKDKVRQPITLDLNKEYEYIITGSKGLTIKRPFHIKQKQEFKLYTYKANNCKYLIHFIDRIIYYSTSSSLSLYRVYDNFAFPITLAITASDNSETYTHTFNSSSDFSTYNKTNLNSSSSYFYSPPLTYDKTYNYTITTGNNKTQTGTITQRSQALSSPDDISSLSFTYRFTNQPNEADYLYDYLTNSKEHSAGTTLRLQGASIDTTFTIRYNNNSAYNYFKNGAYKQIPKGDYTATFTDPICNTVVVKQFKSLGGYSYTLTKGKDPTYDCGSMTIYPDLKVYYQENPTNETVCLEVTNKTNNNKYLYLYDNIKTSGIRLTEPAKYEVKVYVGSSPTTNPEYLLGTLEYDYPLPTISLEEHNTLIFNCNDAKIYLFTRAKGGTPPYTYELWDDSGNNKLSRLMTTEEMGADAPTNTTELVDQITEGFAYFLVDQGTEHFTIKFKDACGNASSQRLTIANIGKFKDLASTSKPFYCKGESIQLQTLDLGKVMKYEWSGPNGFTSHEANPAIPNAAPEHLGEYTLKYTTDDCSHSSTDKVTVKMYGDPVYTTPQTFTTQCIPSKVILKSPIQSFENATLTYQWQWRKNSTATWEDLPNATTPEVEVLVNDANTHYEFRCKVTGPCGDLTQDSHNLTIPKTICSVPVNPHLMNLPFNVPKGMQVRPIPVETTTETTTTTATP